MAYTSGTFGTTNQYIKFNTVVEVKSQNIANNTSVINVKVNIWRTNTGYTTYGTGTLYTNIDGVQRNVGITPSQKITSSPITIFNQDITVGHNADGSKTLVMGLAISHDMFSSSPTNVEYRCNLTTIPRASSFTMSSNDVYSGDTITLNISRASSSFAHEAYLFFGTRRVNMYGITGTTANFVIPTDIIDQIPSATKGSGTMRVATVSNGSVIGYKDLPIYINAKGTVIPTYSSLTIERVDNVVPASWGLYVRGKSKAKITINGAAGVYGSTISKYSISGDGYSATSSSYTTGTLNSAGTVTFTGVVTDSRGRTATKTVSCTVVDYNAPALEDYSVIRCNSNGAANDEGTYVAVTPKYTYSTVNGKNVFSADIKYRKVGTTEWSVKNTLKTSGTTVIIGAGTISPDSSYEVMITLTDSFETITKTLTIPTASTTLDFRAGGKGIAVGKVAEADGLEVAWNTKFNKPVTINTAGNTAENCLAITGTDTAAKIWTGSSGVVLQSVGAANLHLGMNNSTDVVFKSEGVEFAKGIHIKQSLSASGVNPYSSSRIVATKSDTSPASFKIQFGNTTANSSFEIVDKNWTTALFSINNYGDATIKGSLKLDTKGSGNNLNGFQSGDVHVLTGNSASNRPGDWYSVRHFDGGDGWSFQLGSYYGNTSRYVIRGQADTKAWKPWCCVIVSDQNNVYALRNAGNYMHVETSNGAKGVDWWNSDIKLKENIIEIGSQVEFISEETPIGLELINQMKHYHFDYKNGDGHINIGYIGQQLEEIDETLVMKVEQGEDSPLYVKDDVYDNVIRCPKPSTIIPNITLAVQELSKENADLKERVAKLEVMVSQLIN